MLNAIKKFRFSLLHPAVFVFALAGALPAQVTIIEHVIPSANSFPDGIITGPDGALWFTEYGANQIARYPIGGQIVEFPVPTPGSAPYGITVGPDGALWFTEYFMGKIGRITSAGVIKEYDVPTPNSFPAQIAAGPDGALWFTEFNASKIGRLTTQGVFTEYALASGSNPIGITSGPDGALWFTESQTNQIGRIDTGGSIKEYAVPTAFASPEDITTGPDGALWFTEQSTNKIGRITVTGDILEFRAKGGPAMITTGKDGALWFTEYSGAAVARMTTNGNMVEFPVPTPGFLRGITTGPDGRIWFAENSADKIGQVIAQTATLVVSPAQVSVGDRVTISGANFAAGETVRITDGVGPLQSVMADANGGFSISARVRPAPFGSDALSATGQASHRVGVAQYTVRPNLFASPRVVSGGDQVTVIGFGFNSHDSVDMYIDGNFLVGSTTADANGGITAANSVTFTVPGRLSAGAHRVTALGANGVTAAAPFTVQ